YPVKAMKFLTYSVDEICEKNMTILLPLYLLKLRRETDNAKKRTEKNREAALRDVAKNLKKLIEMSILPAIAESEKAGNITHSDAFELLSLLDRLYDYLYGSINEFKDEEANIMLADVLELKYDARLASEVKEQVKERLLEEKRDIARSMKADGDSAEKIARNTGLSVKEIEKL
ncbi:MAG: hypothetical protein FWC89_13125, partial [Defluviitaleaceae bacterium]|nr:hypothetical protein [Defluviitaleaceae bacterium]